ncbi:PilZ domain-containing protein [Endozoicomonas sp. G2_1]|uniref:PilZ domain-containing protein n=1 Tax=Endozoicomonas sp. G2_1 TaxID=2821091 RepID=UPI001ADACAB1|nr:PilZ domain-containing protein [Endozoicomonas sp. G2_1]MBO9490172.1 PilZ domain-containing protein [Endozoicomonas sp. G2_1]
MNQDFIKYRKIIEQFRGQVNKSDFEAKFVAATKNLAKTDKFLLKMELKRLATPCNRLIDLRGLVDGECKTYEHDKRPHFLDDIAIRAFEENIAHYGSYTFGVYEAVKNTENNFRVIYQKEKSQLDLAEVPDNNQKVFDKTQYSANLLSFGPYYNRREERMNFAIPVLVYIGEQELECTSSDLSISGIKLRVPLSHTVKIGQTVELRFSGLEQEFKFGQQNMFAYNVCNIQVLDNIQLVGFAREYNADNEKDGFSQFLKGFIQGNKRRYKVNLDNTISALQARSIEQYLLPKVSELPIFLQKQGEQLLPRYAISSPNNQQLIQYWQDESGKTTLHNLATEERIKFLLNSSRLSKTLRVYSFVHQNKGKSYFYSMDERQLQADKSFAHQFLAFASSKSSFAISELSLLDNDSRFAHSPLTIRHLLAKKDQYLDKPLSEEVKKIISTLPYALVVTDVSDQHSRLDYQTLTYQELNTQKLRHFGHKRLATPPMIDIVGINYRNQRQEPRFKYITDALVQHDTEQFVGQSCDFSISGLKIELTESTELKKGNIVYLSFPKLQKITSAFDLKALPYEVMGVNKKKTTINLRVHVENHQHIGRAFFKLLIDKNRDKLTTDEYVMMIPGLAKSLRNMYAQRFTIPGLVIQTSGSRYKIETLCCSGEYGKLLPHMSQLSDRSGYYNLYPLLSNLAAMNVLTASLKKMQANDVAEHLLLYIAINNSDQLIENAVTTKLDSELETPELKQMFIRNALKQGQFYCVKLVFSRVESPDMNYLNPELSYIGSYAIHRGKQIEHDIWSVAGVGQIIDITEEVLFRHKICSSNASTSNSVALEQSAEQAS